MSKFNIQAESVQELVTKAVQAIRETDASRITVKETKRGGSYYAVWESAEIPGKAFGLKAGKLGDRLPLFVTASVVFHDLQLPAAYEEKRTLKAASLLERKAKLEAQLAELNKL